MGSRNIGKAKRARIYDRDGRRCRRCGRGEPAVYLQVDHIVPRKRGGTNDDSNLQTLCEDCNKRKLDHLPGDAPERIILAWAERVFGPLACNERLTPEKSRQLIRALAIADEFAFSLQHPEG